MQLPTVRSLVPNLRLTLDRASPHVKSVMRRFWTVVVGRGAVQLLTYVDLFLASLLAVGAVSALTYAQVLYLLPISLFGMAVAAAELPELSRLGRRGAVAMRDRLGVGLERITFYVALAVALYLFAGDVIIGALLQRGEFDAADTRLVWYTLAAFSLGLLGTTRSRLLQNGLYALDRPQLVVRIAVLRVALAGLIGAILMFPLDRFAIIGSSTQRVEDLGFGPLVDAQRLLVGGPPRLGIVGLAIGAAASSWVEYRLLRGALEWRIGAIAEFGHDTRWALLSALGAGVLAAGLRSVTDHLPSLVALVIVVGVPAMTYLGITATMRVTEARVIVDRVRRLLPG